LPREPRRSLSIVGVNPVTSGLAQVANDDPRLGTPRPVAFCGRCRGCSRARITRPADQVKGGEGT
jgi:hypothetical protein